MGKLLIIVGIVLIVAGLIITYFPKISLLGKLPGDIIIERENFKILHAAYKCFAGKHRALDHTLPR